MNDSTRRRFLTLCAAAMLSPLAACNRPSEKSGGRDNQLGETLWKGIALGSGAELRLYHPDRKQAEQAVNRALAETARLEKIFSLYRDDSLISRLNREGRLKNPPSDLLAVLSLSSEIHHLTQGAFDPTIQPLWNLYAEHFRRYPNADEPPSAQQMKQTLALVGFKHITFDEDEIRFHRKGMGLSLNGIAQGYITDRIVAVLRQSGIRQALVDMGEIRVFDDIGERTWTVGIRNPEQENAVLQTLTLKNAAFATSGGYGTTMDEAGKFTHLFDPRTGISRPKYRSISVMAETAAVADAFSTAFSIMPEAEIQAAARAKQAKVWLLMPDNQMKALA
ncbi:FAD:protein FMN transferase [Neisseria sp. ZJ106]|uniref:FAD:protein FMN transferase n=1 Tax=Neisseria lisongii TaxID=2912188 RepID=A0ABY7RM15_9NEIS|nr:FAD:protein FMN transferase [Neisseria lisongii]MCF7521847.1 FAD:protein FMN transferase [Neisseria lisongii]WCL71781.1 FAD:protein FMN transferase [Neisseria lisongii]